jgi:glycosyltransferase involved in cell wall biosynthesis
MRIVYLVNQYPKVSHSFIRREIRALERQGFQVVRIAIRGWDAEVVDAEDVEERQRTRYVLQKGSAGLAFAMARAATATPSRFAAALRLAWKMSRRADRPLPYHLAYLAEACSILPWLQQEEVSHVHAHFGTNAAEVAMLVHALGGPTYSFTVHGPEEFDQPAALKLREKIQHAAFVVAVSTFTRSQLYRFARPKDWDKIAVVRCGLERAFHQGPVPVASARARLVCVGRLCEQKGQLLLLRAAAGLAARSIPFELVLAGDGEMRQQIESEITFLGLQQQVRITGWVSAARVREEILAARALVLPSFAEGLPVVLMEAMALRRPVLTTYVAGIPELVHNGTHGWLFPAGDLGALEHALETCLSAPEDVLTRMGDAAHAQVVEMHSVDTEAARLARLFAGAARMADTVPATPAPGAMAVNR